MQFITAETLQELVDMSSDEFSALEDLVNFIVDSNSETQVHNQPQKSDTPVKEAFIQPGHTGQNAE